MSDDLNSTTGAPEPSGKKPGLLSTSTGKVVAIVVGLGVLGIVAGIAVAIVLYVFGSQAVDDLEGQIDQVTSDSTGTSEESTAAVAAEPAEEIPNSEVFTFRDIFVPLIKPVAATTTTTTGSTSGTDTVTPSSSNTLYLQGVVTQDGVMMAVLTYNGQTYTLAPGGVIPGTPWQVLSVTPTSVTMLYGDVQVTLAVGQGITK